MNDSLAWSHSLPLAAVLVGLSACERALPAGEDGFAEPAIPWAPMTYVAYKAGSRMTIDGRIDETDWQRAEWTSEFVDIEGSRQPLPRFRTRAKMLWDETFFYIAGDMEEPDVWAKITERDAVIYHDNDFEVFIDPDGNTHDYYELEMNAFGTEWDLFLVRPYRDGGPAINGWDIKGLEAAVAVYGTLNQPGDRDNGWSVEIAIPWLALEEAANRSAPPEAGDQWRVNFSRVEWRTEVENGEYVRLLDNPPGRRRPEDNWVWSPQGLVNMHYPEMWGAVRFSNITAGGGADSALLTAADRAKWELRRVYYRQRAWFAKRRCYADNLTDLGLSDLSSGVTLESTQHLFEATLAMDDSTFHIRQDGRVW
jgi:hypothetical protein